jgi:hypothetical protein
MPWPSSRRRRSNNHPDLAGRRYRICLPAGRYQLPIRTARHPAAPPALGRAREDSRSIAHSSAWRLQIAGVLTANDIRFHPDFMEAVAELGLIQSGKGVYFAGFTKAGDA